MVLGSRARRFPRLHPQARRRHRLRRERQLEGIAKAKAEGIYKGRRPKIDTARVREMKAQGMSIAAIVKELGISGASIYRVLEAGH